MYPLFKPFASFDFLDHSTYVSEIPPDLQAFVFPKRHKRKYEIKPLSVSCTQHIRDVMPAVLNHIARGHYRRRSPKHAEGVLR